jgi:hypothetical protein
MGSWMSQPRGEHKPISYNNVNEINNKGGFMARNQRECVYVTTMNVLADAGVNFDDGQADGVKPLVTDAMLKSIVGICALSILSGETEMTAEGRAKYTDEKKMRVYASGLVNNWFRKDKRLNGGVKHEAANPGSRAGSGDEQLKALKAFRATKTDAAELKLIDEAIATRKAEIAQTKAVVLTDEQIALIPESLRSLLKI